MVALETQVKNKNEPVGLYYNTYCIRKQVQY